MADNLFQEMEGERRLQKLRVVARRIGAVVLVMLLLGGLSGGVWAWHHHKLVRVQQDASNRYMQAQTLLDTVFSGHDEATNTNSLKKAGDIFANLAEHGPVGVRFYAAMRLADIKIQQGNRATALTLWQTVRDAPYADPGLRNMAAYLWLNAQSESLSPEMLRQGYQKIIQDTYSDGPLGKAKNGDNGAWASLAREGMVAADLREESVLSGEARTKKREEARRLLLEIMASDSAPDGVRQRAQLLIQSMNMQGSAAQADMLKTPSEGQALGDRK